MLGGGGFIYVPRYAHEPLVSGLHEARPLPSHPHLQRSWQAEREIRPGVARFELTMKRTCNLRLPERGRESS